MYYKQEREYVLNYVRNGFVNIDTLEGSSFGPTNVLRITFEKQPSVRSAWRMLEDIFFNAEGFAMEKKGQELQFDVLGYPCTIDGKSLWDILIECPQAKMSDLIKSLRRSIREDKRIANVKHIPLPGDGWDNYFQNMAVQIDRASGRRAVFTIADGWW